MLLKLLFKIIIKNFNNYYLLLSLISLISLSAQENPKTISHENGRPKFGVYGGIAIPTGDFSDPMIGVAKTGFSFGGQCTIEKHFLIDASYTSNPTSISEQIKSRGGTGTSGNWESFTFLAGIKIGKPQISSPEFFFAPAIGAAFISSPKVNYNVTETFPGLVITEYISRASVSVKSFVYSAMIGLDTRRISAGIRYTVSNPSFNYSTMYTESTGEKSVHAGKYQKQVSIFQINFGVIF